MAQAGSLKGCRPGIAIARQAYLYGQGDGKPVTTTSRLAEIAGMTEKAIIRHLPTWQAEREELISNSPETTLAIQLSAKDLQLHKSDMIHLRDQIQQVKWEIDSLDDSIAKLEGIVDRISRNSDNGDAAVALLDRYLRASSNKQFLRKQFLSLQSQWVKLSGVEGLLDVGLTREKELVKGKVKHELKSLGQEGTPRDVTPVNSGVFARRAQDAPEISWSRSDEA